MPSDEHPLSGDTTRPLYADVIVPRHIAKVFTYIVPVPLAQAIAIGRKVLVPFGRTILEGAVIALSTQAPRDMETVQLKEIRSLADDSADAGPAAARLELARMIAEHYVAPWGQCLRLVQLRDPLKRGLPLRYVVTDRGRAALNSGTCPDHVRGMLTRIARLSRGILASTLRKARDRESLAAFETLKESSWIAAAASPATKADIPMQHPQPVGHTDEHGEMSRHTLLAETLPEVDPLWIGRVTDCLQANQAHKIVLHAPWEHRVSRLADAVHQSYTMGKSSIILAGEMAKVDWLGRLLSDLTDLPVTVLSPSWKSDHRLAGQDGKPSVVVGTRSTVFTPCESIGLLWVDGEEDSAFKEPQEPRYHARDAAWMRARIEGALLILASAHTSLESKFDTGAETHAIQPKQADRPTIELVDLRHESGDSVFSRRLMQAMQETLENNAGIVLFLNRKGYAHTLICRDCGWIPRCPTCAVPLGYSREAGKLACRYCGEHARLPTCCPHCQASHLHSVGDGTERVEAEARRAFPLAKIARLDGETLSCPSVARSVWKEVRSGSWDILIGTQALFQREPIPRRGLVGILHADSGLHIPDFRASERTYQHLDEAVGFARPAAEGGRVIVQTRLPMHHAVQAVLSGDPQRFYDEELAARRLLHYPPTCHLATLSVSGKDPREVETAATLWKQLLEESVREAHILTILGPVPTTGRKPKGHARHQLLAKGTDRAFLCAHIRKSVEQLEPRYRKGRMKFVVDMDPVDMR